MSTDVCMTPELIFAKLSSNILKFKRPYLIYLRLLKNFLDWLTFVAFDFIRAPRAWKKALPMVSY